VALADISANTTLSLGGNATIGGTITASGLISGSAGLTISAGTITIPAGSIDPSAILGGVGSNDFTGLVSMEGDLSLNGDLYMIGEGNSIYVRSDGIIVGTADNGASAIYVDVSGNADNGATVKPDLSGNASNGAAVTSVSIPVDASWSKLGADIDGELAGDESGYSVSLSADGLTVAIGAYRNDGNGSNSGHVRVYQYRQFIDDMSGNYHYATRLQNTSDQLLPLIITGDTNPDPVVGQNYWTQLGADIDGENAGDFSGGWVSLSANGLIVAIGARGNTNYSGSGSGHVRVYQYDATKTFAEPSQSSADFGPIGWRRLAQI